MRQAHLLYPPQALKIRVLDEVEKYLERQADETINRVAEDFLFIHTSGIQLPKIPATTPRLATFWHKKNEPSPSVQSPA